MKIPRQLSALLLLISLLLVFYGCSRRSFSESGIMKDGSVNIAWLRSNFEKGNANVLLNVSYGAHFSYNLTPQWEKASSARNAGGKDYFFVPLVNDEYATINGEKRKLNILNEKSYLVAYAADGSSGTLTFLKGDYQLKNNPLAGKSAIEGGAPNKIFSGVVSYTDINKKLVTYSYSSKSKTPSPRTLARSVTLPLEMDPAWVDTFFCKQVANGLMAEWNMPFTVDSLLQLKGNDDEYLIPGQYVFNINTLQKIDLQSYLELFGIVVEYNLDLLPIGSESTMTCSRICHWGAECPGENGSLNEVAVATTTIADNRLNCEAPTWNGACGSSWSLMWSETGSCTWSDGGVGTNPGGGTPLPGDGGSGGSGGVGGGGGGGTTPVTRPRDKLCPKTFKFSKGNDNSYFKTNVRGLRFETNNTQYNNVPNTLVSLSNGISDLVMNQTPPDDYFNRDFSSLTYLEDFFPNLFASNDIFSKMEDGKKYWYFTDYAASKITAWCLDFAGQEVARMDRWASNPGSRRAYEALWVEASRFIRSFMPGSNIRGDEDPNVAVSQAIYAQKCE
ncbi:hypothetical protein LQ567_24180 [Niabella pedocola]|uniref:Uncharacterized protein n=1 Tax=Niabella pedocola TaxID=1752077 RepID=A0ABS8PZX7_9BACT|nr:hypothetical protein [Niabella pedocola]MCD2425903.1 hypothetical protein [Niabella pedocola]